MGATSYQPQGPFSQHPGPGLARILMPPTAESRMMGGVEHAFSSYMPLPQALAWARDMAATSARPFRVVS